MADMLDGNGQWTPESTIQGYRKTGQNYWDYNPTGAGGGWGTLAAALSGGGNAYFNSRANQAEAGNQALRKSTMEAAAKAPDNATMAQLLMSSGVPGMDERGLTTLASGRTHAADQAFQREMADENRLHAEDMARLQSGLHIDQVKQTMPLELEKMRQQLELKDRLEQESMQRRISQLFPSAGAPATAAQPNPASVIAAPPGVSMPAQGTMAPQPAMAPKPQPAAPTGASPLGVSADTAERAKRAMIMGDKDLAAKILTAEPDKKGQDAYDGERAKLLAKDENELRDVANKSVKSLQVLGILKTMVNSGELAQGPGAALGNRARALGEAIGIKSEALTNAQFFESLVNKMALEGRTDMPGAMSDSDRSFLAGMAPSLSKTQEGNRKLIEYMERVQKRNVDVAGMAGRYRQANGGRLDDRFFEAVQQWSMNNPLFSPDEQSMLTKQGSATRSGGIPSGWSVSARPAPAQQAGAP